MPNGNIRAFLNNEKKRVYLNGRLSILAMFAIP